VERPVTISAGLRLQLRSVGVSSGNGNEDGCCGSGIPERHDRKAEQPQDGAGLIHARGSTAKMELHSTRLDLDQTVQPLTRPKFLRDARGEEHNPDPKTRTTSSAEQMQTARGCRWVGHGSSVAGNDIGRPNIGNRSGPNVVISTMTPSSMANTSSVAALCSIPPQARM
jgi:hypothetical protein